MEVHRLEREFVYNGVKLPDTTPTMTPEQVRDTYTHLYPEIATAAIEGPETVAGKLVYRFVRAIGAKGETRKGLLSPRQRNAGYIASQGNADTDESRTEEIDLAEQSKTTKRCQPDNEQEWGSKQEFAVSQCEKTENQAEQNKCHAVGGIEAHPSPPHGRFFRNNR